jgi:serine/threonine-protein kinase
MIGQKFSHYLIIEKLGAGGMGEVYLAEDERLGRKLALKILPEQFTQDADRVRRFEQEARAASALNHPNIITIYEIGRTPIEAGGLHFIATEFIEGETLRHRLNARKLNLREALDIAVQAAGALQAAHAASIVHRDIKPENMMIRPDGYIKILDFGLAKLTEQSSTTDLEGPTKSLLETQPGLVIGTLSYMSPEQARGQRVDGRTDIFSLGIVLYEMVTGRRPFTGETTSDMIAALLVSEPVRLTQLLPDAPPELERIVSRALAKERDARYQTARELLNDLRRVKAQLDFAGGSVETDASEAGTALLGDLSPDIPPVVDYSTNISSQINPPASYETNIAPGITTAQTLPLPGSQPAQVVPTKPLQIRAANRWRWLLPALIATAIVLAAGLVALRYARRNTAIDSVAVLPFVNETADPEAEYLSDGLGEGIINSLSQLPELSVSSQNSVLRYKGKETDAQVVGRELGVKAVLLGRIKRRGADLTVNAELVNVRDGRQIWGERFVRKISDLMAVQDEVTWHITDKLRIRLTETQKATIAKHGTQDAQAYDLYLKGRHFWNQGTPEAIGKADEYFEAAAARDPSYAVAAAGCAACHAAGADDEPPHESMIKAKQVALQVLKADDAIVDAHLTLAQVNLRYDWNFADSEREFKRAIALNPRHPAAHHRYAEFLAFMGRHKEAMEEIWKARSIDPRSLPINGDIGRLAFYAKEYDHALDHLRKTLELDQNYAPAHSGLGQVYEQKGQTQDAILEFMRAKRLAQLDQEKLTALKKAYSQSGREAFWRESLEQLKAESGERYVPSSAIAALHVRLGEHEKAFEALEKALKEKDGGLVELKVDPVFDPLRPHTRFGELLRRIGLE